MNMARPMFPYLWSDGEWYDGPEPGPDLQPPTRRQWVRRGFFEDGKPISRREVSIKASNARLWLEYTLSSGPKPATEVYRLAKLEGISPRGLRRAKKHHKVKSVRGSGKGTGRRNGWTWHFPSEVSQTD